MSVVSAVTTRIASTLALVVRTAVQRLGLGPVVLAATAAAAFLYSLRAGANRRQPRPARRVRPRPARHDQLPADTQPLAPADRKPQWLSRVRRVTIGAKWTLAERCDMFCRRDDDDVVVDGVVSDHDGGHASNENSGTRDQTATGTGPVVLRSAVVAHLKRFAKLFDLYFIVRVDSDEAEEEVTTALKEAGLFAPGLLDKRKLLFCETDVGRVSVARQLEPQLHIDETPEVITGLQRFVHFVALVSTDVKSMTTEPFASNVAKFTSLSSFFSGKGQV